MPTLASLLGLLYCGSEMLLSLWKRSRPGTTSADRGSLATLWGAIGVAVGVAIYVSLRGIGPSWPLTPALAAVCVTTFAAGLALRWYAIRVLGRLFTVDVAIADDHVLVESGPYRWLRHPSYTGALLAFAGLGLSYANLLAIAMLVVVPALAFARRIVVEERALGDTFGPAYAEYRRRTWGLVPGVW